MKTTSVKVIIQGMNNDQETHILPFYPVTSTKDFTALCACGSGREMSDELAAKLKTAIEREMSRYSFGYFVHRLSDFLYAVFRKALPSKRRRGNRTLFLSTQDIPNIQGIWITKHRARMGLSTPEKGIQTVKL